MLKIMRASQKLIIDLIFLKVIFLEGVTLTLTFIFNTTNLVTNVICKVILLNCLIIFKKKGCD